MAPAKKTSRVQDSANEVDDFLAKLHHPLKAELEAVRSIVRGASPRITEGIKWNAPSFRVQEWFATVNIHKDVVMVVLHSGAKVKDNRTSGLVIDDPDGLLEWPARNRALARFPDMKSIRANRKALEAIVRQWIARLP